MTHQVLGTQILHFAFSFVWLTRYLAHRSFITLEGISIIQETEIKDTDYCINHNVKCIALRREESITHWGRVTHICVGNLTIIGPNNGLSPGRRQAIIWTNMILLIGPWGTNASENLIGIQTFSFKKMYLKMSSARWRPICLGLNVFKTLAMECYAITLFSIFIVVTISFYLLKRFRKINNIYTYSVYHVLTLRLIMYSQYYGYRYMRGLI